MFGLRFSIAGAAALLLAGCGGRAVHEAGLEWKGAPLHIEEATVSPSPEALRSLGFPPFGAAPKRRLAVTLEKPDDGGWTDTLQLLEFSGDLTAYAAFQELASSADDFSAGFAVRGERVYFRMAQWVGSLPFQDWKGRPWLENNLALPGVENGRASGLPAAFNSLLYQGRIAGSERILLRTFLGNSSPVPVFSVRLRCDDDTAWLYAAPGMPKTFGSRFTGEPGYRVDSTGEAYEVFSQSATATPLQLRFSGSGMTGIEGCFDENLTSRWLELQSRALKSLKSASRL